MKRPVFIFQQTNKSFDYSLLLHLMGNRYGGGKNQIIVTEKQVKDFESKVKDLVKSMKANGYDENFPIECAYICGVLYILDGQHRLEAAKRCGIEYHYIVKANITTLEQANEYCEKRNNAKRSTWDILEYVYRVVTDVEVYPLSMRIKFQKLIDYTKNYGIAMGCACDIAVGDCSTKTGGAIKKGLTFELKNDAEQIFNLAFAIAKNQPYTAELMSSRAFVRCVGKMYRHPYLTAKMITKVLNKNFKFDMGRVNDSKYVSYMLQEVCNKGLHNTQIHLIIVKGTMR
jgi:ParB-like nuclease domain